ncbi:MAG TPA: hypothetical protein VFR58_02105 [Flavisolibacter sp.]|nr:hypothetical protein [Flavisolibacter sp.]
MIGVFKQKSPGNVAVLLVFGLLLKLPLFLYPKPIIATRNDGHLYRWLIEALPRNSSTLYPLLSFVLLYLQALMLNYMVNEYRLITRQTYLPAMSYLLITSLMPEWNHFSSPLLSNTFIIWMFIYLFSLYNTPNAKGQVFNIGVLAGINSYIFFPSAAFAICIILGLMILRPFRLNEVVLFLVGCLTPYYFHVIYLFLTDELSVANFFPHISVKVPNIKSSIWLAASTLLLALPFLVGGYYVQTHLRKMLIQVRKNWSILLLYLLLAFFVPFINTDLSFHTWVLITASFAAFHACAYFYPPKRWLSLALFFITTGYILFQQYGTPAWQ